MVATNLEDIAVLVLEGTAVSPLPGTPTDAIRLLGAAAAIRELVRSSPPDAIRKLVETLRSAHRGPDFLVPWGDGHALVPGGVLAEVEQATGRLRVIEAAAPPSATGETQGGGDVIKATIGPDADALTQYRLDPLTSREREVLVLLIDGTSDREIADALFISARTASNHVARILQKMQVGSRTAAASFALRHGLTQPTPPDVRRRA